MLLYFKVTVWLMIMDPGFIPRGDVMQQAIAFPILQHTSEVPAVARLLSKALNIYFYRYRHQWVLLEPPYLAQIKVEKNWFSKICCGTLVLARIQGSRSVAFMQLPETGTRLLPLDHDGDG